MHDEGFQKKILNDDGTLNEETIAQIYRYCQDTLQEVNTLNNRLDKKVNIAQGAQNSGKYLTIGTDGNVTTATLPMPTIPIYGIAEVATTEGYLKTYQLYSVADGKTTYHDTKINIPRDFFLKDVELVDVTETSPLEGYEVGKYFKFTFVVDGGAERIQILPIDTLRPCTLTAGDHIEIEGEVCTAHSFIPQYDDVSKVLPHEKVFQYIGSTNSKFTHNYFYERGDGFVVSAGTRKPAVMLTKSITDYNDFLQGYFFQSSETGEDLYMWATERRSGDSVASPFGYAAVSIDRYPKVGDYINSYQHPVEIIAIEEDGAIRGRMTDNGTEYTIHFVYHSKVDTIKYANDSGVVLHIGNYNVKDERFSVMYCPSRSIKTSKGEYTNPAFSVGLVYESANLDHDIKAGADGWVQVDVQPQGIPAELADKLHDQNTDTQLKDGAVKVTDTEVSINKPLMAGRYGQNDGTKALTIGNGTSDTDKSNATTIDLNGNIQTIGDVATPTHSLNNTLQGKVCSFEQMMADYTAGNGMTYMIIE